MSSLITYEEYKTLTNSDPDNETLINQLITIASNEMEAYCDRIFTAADYTEWVERENACKDGFIPRQYPVNHVIWAGDKDNAVEIVNGGSISYTLSVVDTTMVVANENLAYNSYTLTDAASDTLTELVAQIESDTPDLSLTINTDVNQVSKILKPETYVVTKSNGSSQIIGASASAKQFYISHDTIYGLVGGVIVYNAGYATIPDELKNVCALLTQDLYEVQQGNIDTNIKSESVTNHSVTRADTDINTAISKYIASYASTLNNYKRISF